MEYYALIGLTEDVNNPSGLIRRDSDMLIIEQFNRTKLIWESKPEAIEYFMGYNDDAEHITETQADEVIKKWRRS